MLNGNQYVAATCGREVFTTLLKELQSFVIIIVHVTVLSNHCLIN